MRSRDPEYLRLKIQNNIKVYDDRVPTSNPNIVPDKDIK